MLPRGNGELANGLSTRGCDLAPVRTLLDLLEGELLPHERAEEALLVPLVARALDGRDATAAMSRTHAEIEHQVSRLRRLLTGLDNETVQPEDVIELRRLLYGLYAVLRLHNAQEEEGAFSLVPNQAAIGQATATGGRAAREPAPGAGSRSDMSPGTDPGSRDRAE